MLQGPENGVILLTSAGFFNKEITDSFTSNIHNISEKSAVIVTTAAKDKEENQYSKLAKKQLEAMGFARVDFVDLEAEGSDSIAHYDVVYVCGGNTFKLLSFARSSDFKTKVLEVLSKGGCYVGVSAGSLIVGPSVQIANEVVPDKNDINLKDFSGLAITDVTVFPHYELLNESEIQAFELKHSVKIVRLANEQALLITDGSKKLIG